MPATTISLRDKARIDHRSALSGDGQSYGYVWFDTAHADDVPGIRIGYLTPPADVSQADLWQANWGVGLQVHFQAAADLLIAEGILAPRDGKITIKMAGWDWPRAIDPARIDRDITVRWAGHGAKREGHFELS